MPRPTRAVVPLILAATLLTPVACQKRQSPRHTVISHVVIFNMADPARADEFIAACDRMLAGIDSIDSYACGRHIDTGRAVVLSDYDVALIVGFDSPEAYAAYLDDPAHTNFLDQWSAQVSDVRIYDIHDPTP